MRDDLAFPRMLGPITGGEDILASGAVRVIEVGFQASGHMNADDSAGVRVGD